MTSKPKKKTPKPQKSRKPLSARKSVQEANRKMLDFFTNRLQEMRKETVDMEKRVAESNQQLWGNQQQMNKGLGIAEEHIVLLRRVFNDALGGTTRVMKITRRSQTNHEEQEEAQVIDWGWYGEQLHYSDSPEVFMNGVVLTEDEIKERAEKERIKKRNNIVLYLAGKAAEKDEKTLREAYETKEGLDKFLQQFLPPKIVWEEEMHDLAPTIVANVLRQREASRKQQEKMEVVKENSLLRMAVQRVIAGGDGELLKDLEQREELVHATLPDAVNWTPRMSENLGGVIDEVFAEMAKKEQENDPEEVEAAKQELLEETKKFGEEASEVIKLIEEGKDDEARAAMAQLEQKVKDKEAEAERTAPNIPDGAAVFGG